MAYWLIYLVTILSHFVVALFHDDGLVPQARTFKSLEDLKDSTFWRNFVMTRNPIIANTTALYIEDTNSVFIFDERVEPAKWKVWLGWKPDVRLTEVSLGAKSDDISIDHFPLVTVSAEHNSDSGSVERELTDGFGIAVSVNLRMSSKLLTVGLKTGLSSVYGVDVTLTEAIICTASKGGKVQMQVSTKVSYFPLAKSRRVDYVERGKIFNFGSWESVSSRIDNEEYEGAMFYSPRVLSQQRCVTNESYFENIGNRRWLLRLPSSKAKGSEETLDQSECIDLTNV
uniref:Uncharacterized protein n=1 Tax=Candidozyma auris TaxID=498019 RepID=A0A0L0NMZ7_CANAR